MFPLLLSSILLPSSSHFSGSIRLLSSLYLSFSFVLIFLLSLSLTLSSMVSTRQLGMGCAVDRCRITDIDAWGGGRGGDLQSLAVNKERWWSSLTSVLVGFLSGEEGDSVPSDSARSSRPPFIRVEERGGEGSIDGDHRPTCWAFMAPVVVSRRST
jgi:hypothetical protein